MLYIFDVNNIHMYIICVISFNLSPVKTSKGTDIFFLFKQLVMLWQNNRDLIAGKKV